MAKIPYSVVDVFAESKYAGNQLAVFRQAAALSDLEMQQIAREVNFSETTFILSDEQHEGGFDVRIFTPGEEVPFAGHPTLGTAAVIRSELLGGKADKVVLNLKVGQIPVTFSDDGYSWMRQVQPIFGDTHSIETFAPMLGLDASDFDARFPIQEVSTGLPFFIVPLKSLDALIAARVRREPYFDLVSRTMAKGILIFSPETHERGRDLSARVFVDYFGIPEDPATGSGNGCLAGYLVAQRYFGTDAVDVRVEQGCEIGRPSLLLLKAAKEGDGIAINVGGKSVPVARGEWGE
ncbi:MAG: trans-2,3-dihydro-3-hydroxyanthranilate isomerase [Chloroflexota bacterium]|nr:trans-2,3-dihydro-3-hydroxyanthranilate isomerase [Chloroflexota bacterium]